MERPLSAILNRRTVVSLYMKNYTGSCDRQNKSLSAAFADFDRLGYNVIAIGRDGPAAISNYLRKLALRHPLASDPENRFAKAADVMIEKSMYGRTFVGPARTAFVLDRDGTVLAVVPRVDSADHAGQLKKVLAGLG